MRVATPRTNLSSTDSQMSRTWALPNVPIQPMNGMIRTYDNNNRQFARPYSAKTVFFYKEGDEYFTGVRVPISKSRYRNIDSLLDDLNRNIQMPFGVRRLTTPMGRTPIEDISQLEHLGKYVASSSRFSRGINLSALERLKKARFHAESALNRESTGGQSFWVPSSPSLTQQMRLHRHLGLGDVVTSKQIFFVLNGKGRFYRTLLNPLRLPSFEQLLAEVSEGLEVAIYRVYSADGVRVVSVPDMLNLSPPKLIACPRNERPTLREPLQLPSINPNRYAPKRIKTDSLTSTSSENGIEKPRRMDNFRRNTRKTTGAVKKRIPLPPLPPPRKGVSSLPDEGDSGKANSISSYETGGKIEDDRHSSDYPEYETTPSTSYNEGIQHKASIHSDKTEDEVHEHSGESNSPPYHEEDDLILPSESQPGTDRSLHKPKKGKKKKSREETAHSQREVNLPSDEDEKPGTACSQCEQQLPSRHSTARSHRGTAHSQREENLPSRQATACSQREELLPSRLGTACSQQEENLRSRPETACSQLEHELPSRPNTTEEEGGEEAHHEHHDVEEYESEGEFHRHTPLESQREEILPSDDEDGEDRTAEREAATKIQAAYRGYTTRKKLKHVGFAVEETPAINPGETVEPGDSKDLDEELDQRPPTPFEPIPNDSFYTVSVYVGNRWGADTSTDLYIIIQGTDGISGKIPLAQEEPGWLQDQESRFLQNQMNLFYVNSEPLGTLQKIQVGHEQLGYGAGTFVDHVTITENKVEARQFLFVMRKWIDSGQVDGKIERSAPLAAIYYMDTNPGDYESFGRWQFLVHNGMMDGQGGTTSNLLIYGYGTDGSSVVRVENDITMRQVPEKTLIQVDFGKIGDLVKVRFEIDESGEQPDYYLDYVELMDMDTEEKILLRVEKWLKVAGRDPKEKWQSFREVSVFRPLGSVLPVITYDGKITAASFETKIEMLIDNQIFGELHGEWDTGVFPLFYNETKQEYNFKVECVYLGAIRKLKLIGQFHERGKAILEGMSVLQDIWDFYSPGVNVADWLIGVKALVRESTHCPYRYVLGENKIVELNDEQPYFKTLCITGMEGLSTRNKKDILPSGRGIWELAMAVHGTKVPDVWIVNGFEAEHLGLHHAEGEVLIFTMTSSDIKTVDKVRVDIGRMLPDGSFSIYKMKLRNGLTNVEIHFPSLNVDFASEQVIEFPTVLPDIPPKKTSFYAVKVRTHKVEGAVTPKINLIGTDSDIGMRSLGGKPVTEGQEQYDFDGVNVGNLVAVEVSYEGETRSLWTFDIVVSQTDIGVDYSTPKQTVKKSKTKTRIELREI